MNGTPEPKTSHTSPQAEQDTIRRYSPTLKQLLEGNTKVVDQHDDNAKVDDQPTTSQTEVDDDQHDDNTKVDDQPTTVQPEELPSYDYSGDRDNYFEPIEKIGDKLNEIIDAYNKLIETRDKIRK